MQLEQSFTVPVPVEEAWDVLLDLPRVVRCMPGATLDSVDGDAFTGNVKVKLGPITLTYRGKGRFVERDEAARRVVVEASGKDVRSAGTAAATVTATLAPAGDTTTVDVVTDLKITGKPAQFGRGMIAEVSGKLLGQFADCLAGQLGASQAPEAGASPAPDTGSAPAGDSAQEASPAGVPMVATAEPGRAAAEHGSPTPAPAATTAVEPHEAEPVDLLRLTGSTSAGRKLAVAGVGVVALIVVLWLVIRWIARS